MLITDRIRKVRELRGMKQISIALEMGVTQQAYSAIERPYNNVKLETLKKFCAITNIELPFLLALDLPLTEENIETFGKIKYSDVMVDYQKLKGKVEVYEALLAKGFGGHSFNPSDVLKVA